MKITSKRIKILILIFTFSVFTYINFVNGYFSSDSEKILSLGYKGYATEYSLYDGRIFMYLILNIAEILNISIKSFYIILLNLSIFISSASVLIIYESVEKINKKGIKWILLALSYAYIFNFMYINCMEFVECIIMAISILLFIMAAKKVVLDNHITIGFLICFLGILFYQGTVNVFITTAIMFIVLKENEDKVDWKKTIKTLISICVIAAVVVSLDVLMIKIIHIFIESSQIERLELNVISNIKNLANNIMLLVADTLSLFPRYLQMLIVIALITIMYIYSIKNKQIKKFWILIFLISTCYLSCLLIGIAYKDIIYIANGRMFNSVGALISVIMIYIYLKTDIFNKNLMKTIMIAYFIINIINTFYITNTLKKQNEIDKQITFKIQEQLGKNNINKFAIRYIVEENETTNLIRSKILMGTYSSYTYELYCGKKAEKVILDLEKTEKIFTEEKEKMIVQGDVLCVFIYLKDYVQ